MPIMRLVQMMAAAGAEKAFRFTIVTTAPNETFTPPFEITGTYDCNINWGDGNSNHITVWNHADVTHSYATPGTHEIAITGTIIGWRFNNLGDCALYHETKSWGPLRLGNSDGYFYGCVNHTCTATDILDMTGTTTFQIGFCGNSSLTTIPSINSWDWSSTLNIAGMLNGATSFDQDLSGMKITSLINATNFFLGVTLSTANFNALILSWSAQAQTIVANFHGGNSKYTTGGAVKAARDAWVAKGWTITDGGENVGSELITVAADRDFSGGQGNWILPAGNDITFDNISANWNCDESNLLRLALTVTEGTLYRLEVEITVYTSGQLVGYVGGYEVGSFETISPSVDTFILYLTGGSLDWIQFGSINFVGSIDNVSLKECL